MIALMKNLLLILLMKMSKDLGALFFQKMPRKCEYDQ